VSKLNWPKLMKKLRLRKRKEKKLCNRTSLKKRLIRMHYMRREIDFIIVTTAWRTVIAKTVAKIWVSI
ncbi:MAG: hypothetical protein ACKO96_27715, partial [Flammeovirgaceae bacterium]